MNLSITPLSKRVIITTPTGKQVIITPTAKKFTLSVLGIQGVKGNPGDVPDIAFAFGLSAAGSPLSVGVKGNIQIPYDCTVVGWSIVSQQVGDLVLDVKAASFADFPATVSIAGTEKPTLTASQKGENADLSTWSPISAGDILEFVIENVSGISAASVTLTLRRTQS